MSTSIIDYIRTLADQHFWGVLTLRFQSGEIIHILKEERASSLTNSNRTTGGTMTTSTSSAHHDFHIKHHILTPEQLSQRAAELKNAEYLIEGIIPKQGISIAVGDSGLGKSPFLYQGAISVASGATFLGRSVQQGPVLYMDCENGLAQVEELVQR